MDKAIREFRIDNISIVDVFKLKEGDGIQLQSPNYEWTCESRAIDTRMIPYKSYLDTRPKDGLPVSNNTFPY